MWRAAYSVLFYLLLPFLLLRLYWRGIRAPDYRLRWGERFGFYSVPRRCGVAWLHAVSVGEAEAAFLLLRELRAAHPDARFLLTTTTPTGSARVRAVLGEQVDHVYLPYDAPLIVNRFLRHFAPTCAVFLEKEIWPNLYAACRERNIPLYIVNARLSEGSARAYLKIPGLIRPALACVTGIAAQTAADVGRFERIGARPEQVAALGNIKFDLQPEPGVAEAGRRLRETLFAGRFVWILASTHADEEAWLLGELAALRARIPELLVLVAPRHPERFAAAARAAQDLGLRLARRSERPESLADCDVYLADSMGELRMLYAAADVAFVGGSLAAAGGHNVLEAAAAGAPVLFGPHMFNFADIAAGMLAADAAWQCSDAAGVAAAVARLYADAGLRAGLAARGAEFVAANRGAARRVAGLLADAL